MDDYGIAYPSLAALSSLPIDTLKIDRSFTTHIMSNTSDEKAVSTLSMLAKNPELAVIVVGAESNGDHSYLNQQDWYIVQGCLLSRPLNWSDGSDLRQYSQEALSRLVVQPRDNLGFRAFRRLTDKTHLRRRAGALQANATQAGKRLKAPCGPL